MFHTRTNYSTDVHCACILRIYHMCTVKHKKNFIEYRHQYYTTEYVDVVNIKQSNGYIFRFCKFESQISGF